MKTVAICIDKRNGRMFYGKRTSTDEEVRHRLLSMPDKLYVDEYTAKQFTDNDNKEKLVITEHPESIDDGMAFLEKQDIPGDADRIIIFRWDKRYPADKFFDFRFDGWRKIKKDEFPGHAHEKVEMEIWEKKKA